MRDGRRAKLRVVRWLQWVLAALMVLQTVACNEKEADQSLVCQTGDAGVAGCPMADAGASDAAITPATTPPDYANPANWRRQSPMNGYGPDIYENPAIPQATDVFFLYPSTFFPPPSTDNPSVPASWNQTIAQAQVDPGIEAQVYSKAGVFAKAGTNIFVPFYRQAAGAYVLPALLWKQNDANIPAATGAMALAYGDVKLAFLYYLSVLNPENATSAGRRPFILAGHSQGANLLLMLLQDKDFTPAMRARMVAAYVIGWSVTSDDLTGTMWTDHGICSNEKQFGCIVTYNTQQDEGDFSQAKSSPGSPGVPPSPPRGIVKQKSYSVNPLSWVANGPKDSDTGFNMGITEETEPAAVTSDKNGGARFFKLNSVRPGNWRCPYDLRPQLGPSTTPLCVEIPVDQQQCCTKWMPVAPPAPGAVQPSWTVDAIGGWSVFHHDIAGFTGARNMKGALVVDPNGFAGDPVGNYKNLNAPYNTNDSPTGVNAGDPANQAPGWYHNYDYAFFWKSLEQNVIDRIQAYHP